MIDTGTALIIGSFISLIGFLIFQERSVKNYFRKENFKLQKSNIMAENKLKLKKLEREMGLTGSNSTVTKEENTGIGGLLPLLKNLDSDTITNLLPLLSGGGGDGSAPEGLTESLLNFAEENPEIVKGLLDGLKIGKPKEEEFTGQT